MFNWPGALTSHTRNAPSLPLRTRSQDLNPTSLCVPSQNGLIADAPQRQSATVERRRGMGFPSLSRSSIGPRTKSGPSLQATIWVSGVSRICWLPDTQRDSQRAPSEAPVVEDVCRNPSIHGEAGRRPEHDVGKKMRV